MARKTIEVAEVKRLTNEFMIRSSDSVADRGKRDGVGSLCEQVLHATGNYEGFQYVRAYPDCSIVGADEIHACDYDSSRRRYY